MNKILIPEKKRGSSVDFLCEHLQNGIFVGRFAPGQRLIERDLIEEFGLSRGPVREAFHRLSADGLVDLIPHRGAIVRRLLRQEVQDLFQIRESLEGLAAGLAAKNINQGQNRKLFTKVWKQACLSKKTMQWNLFMENNQLFHKTIVEISNNNQLYELVEKLRLVVVMFQVGKSMHFDQMIKSNEDHKEIAEAILDGDEIKAQRAMSNHVRNSHRWIDTLPESVFKPKLALNSTD